MGAGAARCAADACKEGVYVSRSAGLSCKGGLVLATVHSGSLAAGFVECHNVFALCGVLLAAFVDHGATRHGGTGFCCAFLMMIRVLRPRKLHSCEVWCRFVFFVHVGQYGNIPCNSAPALNHASIVCSALGHALLACAARCEPLIAQKEVLVHEQQQHILGRRAGSFSVVV